jgi:hypothetical protein
LTRFCHRTKQIGSVLPVVYVGPMSSNPARFNDPELSNLDSPAVSRWLVEHKQSQTESLDHRRWRELSVGSLYEIRDRRQVDIRAEVLKIEGSLNRLTAIWFGSNPIRVTIDKRLDLSVQIADLCVRPGQLAVDSDNRVPR